MSDVLKLGLKLLLITTIAALALGLTNIATEDPIRIQIEKSNVEARRAVLPEAIDFEKVDTKADSQNNSNFEEVYAGKSDGKIVGYTFKINAKGYGGDMEVYVGIRTAGTIASVKIGNHQETPGLGAKASETSFQQQYQNKPINNPLIVVKTSTAKDEEISAITGATVTTRAVTNAVNSAIEYYHRVLRAGGAN